MFQKSEARGACGVGYLTASWVGLMLILGVGALGVGSCRSDSAPLETSDRPDAERSDDARIGGSSCGLTDAAIPQQVVFRLVNNGAAPVFVHRECVTEFSVSSCTAGYADKLGPEFRCGPCACDDRSCTGGVVCGGCLGPHGVSVPAFGALNLEWSPERVEDGRLMSGVHCVKRSVLPSASYLFDVSVYDSEQDAAMRRKPRVVRADFLLAGASPQIVEANVNAPQADAVPATFRLINETGKPIFVQDSDFWKLERDGVDLPVQNTCEVCDCRTCPACAVCGRSIATVKEIAAGASHDFSWDGFARPLVENGCRMGLACEAQEGVSASSLKLRVTYSLSHRLDNSSGAPDDLIGTPIVVTTDFAHPATQVVVVRAR